MSVTLAIWVPLWVSAVFVLSGVSKVFSPGATARSALVLNLPLWTRSRLFDRVWPWLEVALAACIVFAPSLFAAATLGIAAVLFATFCLATLRPLMASAQVSCECFGGTPHQITARTVTLNAVLAAISLACATYLLLGAPDGGSVALRVALDPDNIALPLIFLLGATTVTWWARTTPRRQLNEASTQKLASGENVLVLSPETLRLVTSDGDWIRPARIAQAKRKPLLLIFVKEGCNACETLLHALTATHGRGSLVDIRTVGAGTSYDWEDVSGMVRAASGIRSYPSALAFDSTGRLAAPTAEGIDEIMKLIVTAS
ncbi:MauE/DoxX family redox-associated membrane protein [Arthrobacter sp. NPDC090010]|uniref:MauE/DoxX family redox-associated membrane protein n=1 Tax=Arthrobacter sp. NPDC090010 TaxID=3363942 RepID=UPI0038086D35